MTADVPLRPNETLAFIDLAFSRLLAAAHRAGDQVATSPDLDGANSIFGLVTHCIGLTTWWLGHELAGAESTRDRDAEFASTGTVAELDAAVAQFRERLPMLVDAAHAAPPVGGAAGLPSGGEQRWPWTNGGIILHVMEELFQHAGHAEVTADLLKRNITGISE